MVAICGICVRYAVYMGSSWGPRAEDHMQVGGKLEPLGVTSNITEWQKARRQENRIAERQKVPP